MSSQILNQSYMNTHDHPLKDNVVMRELFDETAQKGLVGELINLETKERITTTDIIKKADQYAKGLLTMGLIPLDDSVSVFGCCSTEAICMWVACLSTGIGYAHSYNYIPRDQCIANVMEIMKSKVILTGEGAGGRSFEALVSMFNEDSENADSEQLSTVEHVFYDNSYNSRNPSQKFIKPLDELVKLGEKVTNEELGNAKKKVQPDWPMNYIFTSGSTGKPKGAGHTHYGLTNDAMQLTFNIGNAISMNPNVDDMVTYAATCWLLCGQINKLVHIHDMYEGTDWNKNTQEQVKAIMDEEAKHLFITGAALQSVVDCTDEMNLDIQTETLMHGGQIISKGTIERNGRILKGIALTVYGMTETMFVAATPFGSSEQDYQHRLAGRLYPKKNLELRVVNEKNEILPIGKVGELQIKSYSNFKEYKDDPERTKEAFTDDGYFKTGDTVMMFEDGSIVIKGRTPDGMRFKIDDEVIYPGPIESILSSHPDIRAISVVSGGLNDWFGDEIAYCIKLRAGVKEIKEEELLAMTEENMWPARILYMDAFPTTSNGRKIDKSALRDKVRKMVVEDESIGKTNYFKEMETSFVYQKQE